MSSKDSKTNPDVVAKLMGTIIKRLADENTGKTKPVKTYESLKGLAENKNKRGVVVIKNIQPIIDDVKKLQKLRTVTKDVIENNKKSNNNFIIKTVINEIKNDPSILDDNGVSEIYTDRFISYIKEQKEGVDKKEQKEGVDKKEEKEGVDKKEEKEEKGREIKQKPLEDTITKLETKGIMSSTPVSEPSKEKVKVSQPSIAQQTEDDPQIIMTRPQIDNLPTMPVFSDINTIESSSIFGDIINYITGSNSYRLFGYQAINDVNALISEGINQIPLRWRRIIKPALEGAQTLNPIEISRALTHVAILYYALPTLGISSNNKLTDLVANVLSGLGDSFLNSIKEKINKNVEGMEDLVKDVNKKIPDEPDEKKPDGKQPEEKQPDGKQPEEKQPEEKQPEEKPLTRRKRIVPSLISSGLVAGVVAGAAKLSEPARSQPIDTLDNVVGLGTSMASGGLSGIALNELRSRIVEAIPETSPYINSLGAVALTNILGGILGYKAGEFIKETTNIEEKIKEEVKGQMGIKETPIKYDPEVLDKSKKIYEQQEKTNNKFWQPKTIVPSTSILDESNQEKYIDDLETSAFDYIAPTSEGSEGTIYTNPLKTQQFINDKIRFEGAGMYIPYNTWGKLNDPNNMSQEQLKLMLLGTKLPDLKFEPMDNATTFENVQTVHLVNNEQDSIEMFSPYSQFSNVDNNWWSNEKSVLYTINP